MPGGPTYLVLDIETVPDRELLPPVEPVIETETRDEAPTATPNPASPTRAAERTGRSFPPLYAHRPVVIGVMWMNDELGVKRIGTIGENKDEASMMADFATFMARFRPHVVSWNGRCFDMPVLALRALRFGLDFGWYYQGEGYRYRYSEEGHLDLCDTFSDHGAAKLTSLDGAARLIGLPGKSGVDGSQVEGLYYAGQIEALRRYCLSDVAQTAFLFLRWKLVSGQIDRDGYRRVASGLLAALETDGRFAALIDGVDRQRLLLGD
jgi:predicted PolB exonuclease-like 3'-5' exonuclease